MSRVVLVTGGTRGIGRAIARTFLDLGDTVLVCGRRTPEELPEGLDLLTCDVREEADRARLFDVITRRHGRLDVLVNNAGGSPYVEAATAPVGLHDKILELNLHAPLHLMQRANARMQAQEEGGVIVNVASVSGLRPSPGTAAYGAAKAGLLSLTRSLAVEWAPRVRVVAVSPGLVATAESRAHYPDPEAMAATVPAGRFATPAEVAHAVAFLASPGAAYATGSHLVLDGGGDWPGFLRPVGLDRPMPGPTAPDAAAGGEE